MYALEVGLNNRGRFLKIRQNKKGVAVLLMAILALAMLLVARSYLFVTPTVSDLVSQHPGLKVKRDVTSQYCSREIECIEAWETDYGVYARFSSENSAEHWGKIFGASGAQWKNFTLDARAVDLDADERMSAVQILLAYDGV